MDSSSALQHLKVSSFGCSFQQAPSELCNWHFFGNSTELEEKSLFLVPCPQHHDCNFPAPGLVQTILQQHLKQPPHAAQMLLPQGSYQCIPLPTEPMDPSQAENAAKGAEHPAHPIPSPRHPWGVFTSNTPCLASQPEPRLSSQHDNCKLHLKLQLKGLRVLNHQTCRQQLNTSLELIMLLSGNSIAVD